MSATWLDTLAGHQQAIGAIRRKLPSFDDESRCQSRRP
jgi:hypothetical protein